MKKFLLVIFISLVIGSVFAQDIAKDIYGKFYISPESRSIYREVTFYVDGKVTFCGETTKEYRWFYDKDNSILYIGDFGFVCEVKYEVLSDGSFKETIRLISAYHEYRMPDVILTKCIKEATP